MGRWPVGTQLYVYMQTYGKDGKKIDDHMDTVLGEVAAAGYDGFEGFLGLFETREKADALRAILAKYRLKLPSCYAGGAFHTRDEAEKSIAAILKGAEAAAALGVKAINNNPSPIGRHKTDDELKIQCENLNRLGESLKKLGMEFHIHNHDPEIRNNAKEFRAHVLYTDPALVGLCVDTHWVYRGGMDPLTLMRECGKRIKSLHIRNSVKGVWSEELGDGDVDYRAIARFLRQVGFTGWLLVELALEKGTPSTRLLKESLKISRDYVRQVFRS